MVTVYTKATPNLQQELIIEERHFLVRTRFYFLVINRGYTQLVDPSKMGQSIHINLII